MKAPILVIDNGRPDRILVDGRAVPLQPRQFQLVRLLAAHAGAVVPYRVVYVHLWGNAAVEDSQLHFHKRRLVEAIRAVAPDRAGCIQAVKGRGFLLDIPADRVLIVPGKVAA